MSNRQTEKSNYPSLYSPGKFVTFAQYLAEMMCGRKAKADNVDLPRQFWETSNEWKRYFKMQVLLANKLAVKYPEQVIMTALKEMPYAYSLRLQALEKKMAEVNNRVSIAEKKDIKVAEQPSQGRFNRKSKLSNLDE